MSNLPARRNQGDMRLYKDPAAGKLAGVCSGLAQWSGIPTVFWRLAFVLGTLGWGVGIPLYALMWFLMDSPPEPEQPGPTDLDEKDRDIWNAVKSDMDSLDLRNDR